MAQCTFTNETALSPAWAAEELTPDRLVSGGRLTAAAFPFLDQVTVMVAAAGAAIDATEIPIAAIAMDNEVSSKTGVVIPAGTTLGFGGDKFATLAADASIGDETLTVEELVTALVDGDTATYNGMNPRKAIASGLLVGRTFAERAAGTGFGVADVATPDNELFLIAFPVEDAAINPDVVLLRHNSEIYEDKLPGWAGLGATAQAAIRARYHCLLSAG